MRLGRRCAGRRSAGARDARSDGVRISQLLNPPGLYRSLRVAQEREGVALERLATGKRINRGKDDPSGMVAAEYLKVDLATLTSKLKGMERTSAFLGSKDGALSAVGDLRSAGLVVAGDDGVFVLDDQAVRAAARSAAEVEIPMDPAIGYGMTEDEQHVLGRFFSGRVLNEIPTQRAKRLVVLQRLALEFDPGRRYTEFEVNELLGAFHPDWSALRRGLVDEGLLDREPIVGGNLYWRSGGRVTDLPAD